MLIEDAGPGMNLLQDLRRSPAPGTLRPIGVRPEGSKLERMAAQTAKIEAATYICPRSALAGGIPIRASGLPQRPTRRSGRQRLAVPVLVAAREFPIQRAHRRADSLLSAEDPYSVLARVHPVRSSGLSFAPPRANCLSAPPQVEGRDERHRSSMGRGRFQGICERPGMR